MEKNIMNVKKINLSDNALVLWNYYSPDMPFFIGMIGSSDCRSIKDDNYYVERTNSQILAIEYIKKGSGTLCINGKNFKVSEGSVFFLTKGSNHKYFPDKDNLWVKDWLIIDGELAHKMVDWYLPKDTFCINDFNAEYLFSGLEDLYNTYKEDFEEFIKYSTLLFCSFMVDVNAALSRKGKNSVAYKIKYMLDYSSHENLSVKEIADKLHYSVNYVIRTFKKQFGCTPAQYYIKRKMDLAKMYLRTSDYTLSEISDKLNFIDQHYFSNAFRRYTGMTPSVFRAKFRS